MKSNKNYPSSPHIELGFGKTFSTAGEITEEGLSGSLVRFKAVGATKFRLTNHTSSEILMSADETEYFFIPEDRTIYLVSGSLNLMW